MGQAPMEKLWVAEVCLKGPRHRESVAEIVKAERNDVGQQLNRVEVFSDCSLDLSSLDGLLEGRQEESRIRRGARDAEILALVEVFADHEPDEVAVRHIFLERPH